MDMKEEDLIEDRVLSFKEYKPEAESKLKKSSLLKSGSECESNFQNLQGLMTEKERLNQEQEKIRNNKFLKMVDRTNAMKSVRSLSRTIDDLINKEKEKIEDHYNSKVLERSRISNLESSRLEHENHPQMAAFKYQTKQADVDTYGERELKASQFLT